MTLGKEVTTADSEVQGVRSQMPCTEISRSAASEVEVNRQLEMVNSSSNKGDT